MTPLASYTCSSVHKTTWHDFPTCWLHSHHLWCSPAPPCLAVVSNYGVQLSRWQSQLDTPSAIKLINSTESTMTGRVYSMWQQCSPPPTPFFISQLFKAVMELLNFEHTDTMVHMQPEPWRKDSFCLTTRCSTLVCRRIITAVSSLLYIQVSCVVWGDWSTALCLH